MVKKDKLCSVDLCGRKCLAKSLCSVHYRRLARTGEIGPPSLKHNKHGKSYHPLLTTWISMRNRCENPKDDSYKWYGARGIKVCERWLNLGNFIADMGDRPEGMTLDRKDNNGNYEPANCRWATHKEQAANKGGY